MLVATGAGPELVVVDEQTLMPRFWATAWVFLTAGRSLALNTRKSRLRHIDAFYDYCDTHFGNDALDQAIGVRHASAVQEMLESYLVHLTHQGEQNTTSVQRWSATKSFLLVFAQRLAPHSDAWNNLAHYIRALPRLRPRRRARPKFVRSIPSAVLRELIDIAHPDSERNPFSHPLVRRRNWLVFNLLLLCGLRRGESLLLTADAVKRDIDTDSGEECIWLDVTSAEDEDKRSTRPSIKTESSHRRVPLSQDLAHLIENYVNEDRVDSSTHGFMITSQDGRPLSAESVNKILWQLTSALSERARAKFLSVCGNKKRVSPHDLRHTCATARWQMFLSIDGNRALALQRMRAFFGWSVTSDMPEHYARAAIQSELLNSWSRLFDGRLSVLRSIQL